MALDWARAIQTLVHQLYDVDDEDVEGYDETISGNDGHVRANHPSSSSRRVRAGRGAPGASFSYSGSLTEPPWPKGLNDCSLPRNGVEALEDDVGGAASLRLHPSEFIESRNEDEAMAAHTVAGGQAETVEDRLQRRRSRETVSVQYGTQGRRQEAGVRVGVEGA